MPYQTKSCSLSAVRRRALRRGFRIVKSDDFSYGPYTVVEIYINCVVRPGIDLEDVAAFVDQYPPQ